MEDRWAFRLGERVRDAVTGYAGTVIGRAEYMAGTRRYSVQSKELNGGIPVAAQWIDEGLLEMHDDKRRIGME